MANPKASRRAERMAKIKEGLGTFVYRGECQVSEYEPTPLLHGKSVPVLNSAGMPVFDASGRQIYERVGSVVREPNGQPKMGGTPKVVKHELDTVIVRGVKFPLGKPVSVESESLAIKCRCLAFLEEVEPEEGDEPAPQKRSPGRPRKAKPEAEEPESEPTPES